MKLEYFKDLIDLRVTIEEGLLLDELGEDAADCPNIHAQTILPLAKEDFRSAVPECLDLMRKSFDWYAKSTSQTEICYFKIALAVNKQILRFEISMNYATGMAIVDPVNELKH